MITCIKYLLNFSERVWDVFCVGNLYFSLGKKRSTSRLWGHSLKCRKWHQEKGCGSGSSRQLTKKPRSWSKLPSPEGPRAQAASQGCKSIYWRKAKPNQEIKMHTLIMNVSVVYSLIPSKDGYWARGGYWMAGIINIGLAVLCGKQDWISGRLLVIKISLASRGSLFVHTAVRGWNGQPQCPDCIPWMFAVSCYCQET